MINSETWEALLWGLPVWGSFSPNTEWGCLCVFQAGAEISTVNPEQYSKRFNEFMSNILT